MVQKDGLMVEEEDDEDLEEEEELFILGKKYKHPESIERKSY